MKNVYCIYDDVAKVGGELFTAPTHEVAIRRFGYVATNSPMVSSDLSLLHLGFYDEENSLLVPLNQTDDKVVITFGQYCERVAKHEE